MSNNEPLFILPSFGILSSSTDMELTIEAAGRTAWQSGDKAGPGTAGPFIQRMKSLKHESVLEHGSITVRIVCDRGVSHEIVRHRIASFTQESTRYCNYVKERHGERITFIIPPFFSDGLSMSIWKGSCRMSQADYFALIRSGAKPEEARTVLNHSVKTELVETANPREWRHIFKMRCDKATNPHPQMREIMVPMRALFAKRWPALFEDLLPSEGGGE